VEIIHYDSLFLSPKPDSINTMTPLLLTCLYFAFRDTTSTAVLK